MLKQILYGIILTGTALNPFNQGWAEEPDALGGIQGRVVDTVTGEPVREVAVSLRNQPDLQTKSNLQGWYQLANVPEGTYTVVASKNEYRTSEVPGVEVSAEKVSRVNFPLEPRVKVSEGGKDVVYELEAFTVEADDADSGEYILLYNRRRSAKMMDGISEDKFSELGIGDAAEALSKTVGSTIVDGKYAVIRGLGDRYTNTRLNNLSVPSSDPDRLAVQLDQFPSHLLESVMTNKTFTADQPGAFSGGSVNLKTKSFPRDFFVKFKLGLEYNTQSTGEDVLSASGGGQDWMGKDDGTRALDSAAPDKFPALTATSVKLAARLGDFGPADEMDRSVRYFNNRSFYPNLESGDPNLDWSLAFGDRIDAANDQVFGYMVALTYDRSIEHYTDGVVGRYSQGSRDLDSDRFVDLARVFSPDPSVYNFHNKFVENPETPLGEPPFGVTSTSHNVDWGAFGQLSWQPSVFHEVNFRAFHNQSGEDRIKRGAGEAVRSDSGAQFRENYDLLYTERGVSSLQLSGESLFRSLNDATFEWRAAYSESYQEQPDYRNFEFKWDFSFQEYDPSGITQNRYFRELNDENYEISADFTYPVELSGDQALKLKTGVFYSESERTNRERAFLIEGFRPSAESILQFPNPAGVLGRTEDSLRIGTYMREISSNANYDGSRTIDAGYLMADWRLNYSWRFVAGLRVERSDILTDSHVSSAQKGIIDQSDSLPHASLVYSLTDDMNFRLAYGETLARGTFREMADIRIFDPFTDETHAGNPDLELTRIKNYDFRWEWFPERDQIVALSLFYKDLDNPIENVFDKGRIFPENVTSGEIYGVEFELKQPLGKYLRALQDFSLGLNLSLIESEVAISPSELEAIREVNPDAKEYRELYGQSHYIVNVDLTYRREDLGTTLSGVFNVSGERLDLVTTGALPDVYEQPFPTLDLIYIQQLSDRLALKFSAKNLLDREKEKTLEHRGQDFIYESYTRGRFFAISMSYEFN